MILQRKTRILLYPHPQTPCCARIKIKILKNSWIFKIQTAKKNELALPQGKTQERRDFLWQATCLECFIFDAHSKHYWEYNFAPNGAFALYAFDSYRQKSNEPPCKPPLIFLKKIKNKHFIFKIIPQTLPPFNHPHFHFCVVLKNKKGELFYFAEKHFKEKPDFHFFPR